MTHHRTLAVALHDIEPATFERCALMRDWLSDHGVARVTLLVIPARDLHPLGARSPEMVEWLMDQAQAGDTIAQHGFQHVQSRRAGWPAQTGAVLRGARTAEFVGLDALETRRAVDAGWRLLKLAGLEPHGFVAPSYAYTPALRETLDERYSWWAGLTRLYRTKASAIGISGHDGGELAPALGLATSGWLRRSLSPAVVRTGSRLAGETLRLDLHPGDLDHPRHMLALESVLGRCARRREAVTYDELAGIAGERYRPRSDQLHPVQRSAASTVRTIVSKPASTSER
jgi:predicted deacetylase